MGSIRNIHGTSVKGNLIQISGTSAPIQLCGIEMTPAEAMRLGALAQSKGEILNDEFVRKHYAAQPENAKEGQTS